LQKTTSAKSHAAVFNKHTKTKIKKPNPSREISSSSLTNLIAEFAFAPFPQLARAVSSRGLTSPNHQDEKAMADS
jgi:hypothetical protein